MSISVCPDQFFKKKTINKCNTHCKSRKWTLTNSYLLRNGISISNHNYICYQLQSTKLWIQLRNLILQINTVIYDYWNSWWDLQVTQLIPPLLFALLQLLMLASSIREIWDCTGLTLINFYSLLYFYYSFINYYWHFNLFFAFLCFIDHGF